VSLFRFKLKDAKRSEKDAKQKQSHFVLLSFASSRLLRVSFRLFFASFRIFLFDAKKGHLRAKSCSTENLIAGRKSQAGADIPKSQKIVIKSAPTFFIFLNLL
jgi:hypothetical protein